MSTRTTEGIGQRGLTTLESAILVAVLGVLCAVAIPTFARYGRLSKTTEASEKLAYLFRAATTYYSSDRVSRRSLCVPASSKTLPSVPVPKRVRVDFSADPTFSQLDFSSSDPVIFAYTFVGVDRCGVRGAPAFTARAEGDLDGDANRSLFERAARATASGEIESSLGLYVVDRSE